MKRMSSDMDSREVVREMRSGFSHWTNPVEEEEEELEFIEEVREDKAPNFKINMMPPGENIFNGLKYNFKYGSGLAMVKNAKDNGDLEEEPQEAQEEEEEVTTTTTKTTTSQTTMIVTTLQSTSSERTPPTPATTMTSMTREEYIEPSTVTEQMQTTTLQDNIEQDSTYPLQNSVPPTELPPVKDYLYEAEDYPATDYNFFTPDQELPVATTEYIEEEKTTEMFEEIYDYSGESM